MSKTNNLDMRIDPKYPIFIVGNKKFNISREMHHSIKLQSKRVAAEIERQNKEQQFKLVETLKKANAETCHEKYDAETAALEIGLFFTEEGGINEFEDNDINFKGELLEKVKSNPEMKQFAEDLIDHFMIGMNKALIKRKIDLENKIKKQIS